MLEEREDCLNKATIRKIPAQDIDNGIACLLIDRFPSMSLTFRRPYQVKLNGESSNCRNTVFFLFSSSFTVVAFFAAVEVIIIKCYARISFRSQGFREKDVNSPAMCFFAAATQFTILTLKNF